jgi:DNA-directed RNA polymerase beta' subunit
MSYVTPDNAVEIYIEDVVIPNLEKLIICGISGITNMFFANEKDKWFIETEGSNFSEVLAHPDVDKTKSITNNIWELYETLGIEAVREYMIEELTASMTGINVCHSRLLVDKMTYNGTIVSISRYAMRSEGSGPLGKASFEETLDNLLNAAVSGERESTDGVSAGIICGKLGKFGTGLCELRIDVRKLAGLPPIVEGVSEKV